MNLFEYSTPYSLSGFFALQPRTHKCFFLLKFPSKPYIPNDRPVVKASYSQLCTFQSFKKFQKKIRNYATCIPHNFHTCFNVRKERYFKLQNNAHVEKKTPTSECEFKKNVNDTRSIDKESSFSRYASNSTIEWTTQTTAVNYLFPFYTTDVCYCGTGIISLYSFTAWMEFMVFLGETQRSKLGQVNIEFNSQKVKL